jgi:hypothetical protein
MDDLLAHAPRDDHGVHDTTEADDARKSCGRGDRWPGDAEKRRQQQGGAEMNDRQRRKGGAGVGDAYRRPVGDERHDDELQADERARRRADDHVEAVPSGRPFSRRRLGHEQR